MPSDQLILEVLKDWSFWDSPPPPGLPRQLKLPQHLYVDLALIIQGVRRGGKSTLLSQLPKHYHLPLTCCYYCNFEDPRLMNMLDHQLLSRIMRRKPYLLPVIMLLSFYEFKSLFRILLYLA